LATGKRDELPRPGHDGPAFARAGDGDPAATPKFQKALVTQQAQRAEDRVPVHAEHRGQIAGRRQALPWTRFSLGDRAPQLGRDLLVEPQRLRPIDLDLQHGASNTSFPVDDSIFQGRAAGVRAGVLQTVIDQARRRARARRIGALALALALVALGLGTFFSLHRGGPGEPKPAARFVRFQALPLDAAGGGAPTRDVRAAPRVVGRLDGATIFAVPRRNGYWEMFSVDEHGRVGGGGSSRVSEPHALRIGVEQVGRGGLFTSRAYLVVAGSTLAKRGTKLFLVRADGSRERIKLILVERSVGAGFYYYVIPGGQRVRVGRATALELVRGSRLVARQALPLPYQVPRQPGPLPLRGARQVLDGLLPSSLG
jgi:hypothetical protein